MQEVAGKEAFGKPGIEPRGRTATRPASAQHIPPPAISGSRSGTASSRRSTILPSTGRSFAICNIWSPTARRFFHEEKRDLTVKMRAHLRSCARLSLHNADPEAATPSQRNHRRPASAVPAPAHTHHRQRPKRFSTTSNSCALCATSGGRRCGNNGYIAIANGQRILMAQKGGKWMAMGATVPFSHVSCGYVGASDGWTDLHDNFKMDWEFDTRQRRKYRPDRRAGPERRRRNSRSAWRSATASTGRSRICCSLLARHSTNTSRSTRNSGMRPRRI